MKLIRFSYREKIRWGVLKGDRVFEYARPPFGKTSVKKRPLPLSAVRVCAPVEPSKIILAGLNYRDHAAELNMPLPKNPIIFLKPPTTIIGPSDAIRYPANVDRVDYEAELAVVIKKTAKNIPEKDVPKYILGYTCLNDVTARTIQTADGQWTRAKSFDTFCPIGPWIETKLDPSACRITATVNNEIKQDSSTSDFIFSINYLISFISRCMTLLPGDVIATGTPPGIGPLTVGDTVSITIEGIGSLTNQVVTA